MGSTSVFDGQPDLRTVAHEVAHVVQQRAGVQLLGGVGRVGDVYEREADAAAARVVSGQAVRGEGRGAPGPVREASPSQAIQRYVEVPTSRQSRGYYAAGDALRVSDDGKMAVIDKPVFQGGKRLWATSDVIRTAQTRLADVSSTLTLSQGTETLSGRASRSGPALPLYKVELHRDPARKWASIAPRPSGHGVQGQTTDDLRTLEGCNVNALDIMGVQPGGGNTAIKRSPRDAQILTDYIAFSIAEHSSEQTCLDEPMWAIRRDAARDRGNKSTDKAMLQKSWKDMNDRSRRALAKRLGMNEYARPGVGDGIMAIDAAGTSHKTYQFHVAPVIARSGEDYITLENLGKGADRANGDAIDWSNAWFIRMYGPYKRHWFRADEDQSYFGQHAEEGSLGNKYAIMALHLHNKRKG